MRGSSKWAHRQGKRAKAVAFGCYLPEDEPNPLDVERDGEAVERERRDEDRREARQLLRSIKQGSGGAASVGEWEPSS